jgi:hypothetical protein
VSSFTNIKEMNMSIDQHIEELRAELPGTLICRDERRWNEEAALPLALAEREAIWAEQEALMSAEPPF